MRKQLQKLTPGGIPIPPQPPGSQIIDAPLKLEKVQVKKEPSTQQPAGTGHQIRPTRGLKKEVVKPKQDLGDQLQMDTKEKAIVKGFVDVLLESEQLYKEKKRLTQKIYSYEGYIVIYAKIKDLIEEYIKLNMTDSTCEFMGKTSPIPKEYVEFFHAIYDDTMPEDEEESLSEEEITESAGEEEVKQNV